MAVRVSDWIAWTERNEMGGEPEQKQNRITFWKRDGRIQCGDEHDATEAVGLGPDGRPGESISYRIGDQIKLPNGRTFTIFYILPGNPTWFFTHADPEVLEDTGIVVDDGAAPEEEDDDEFEDFDEDEAKTIYFAVIENEWYITHRPVAPKFQCDMGYNPDAARRPAPLLPPNEYPTIMVASMRGAQGGGTTRKCSKHKHRTTMKKRTH
jgi:hypothetical protein